MSHPVGFPQFVLPLLMFGGLADCIASIITWRHTKERGWVFNAILGALIFYFASGAILAGLS